MGTYGAGTVHSGGQRQYSKHDDQARSSCVQTKCGKRPLAGHRVRPEGADVGMQRRERGHRDTLRLTVKLVELLVSHESSGWLKADADHDADANIPCEQKENGYIWCRDCTQRRPEAIQQTWRSSQEQLRPNEVQEQTSSRSKAQTGGP